MADIADEYRSSLSELNFNSKPHINMLTMLAEENASHASVIVKTIVDHINSVSPEVKLPSLYLVDSIVKNVGKIYISLFSKHLVSLFTSVFEKVDENIRSLLYKLRSTWTGLFPNTVLLQLDRSVVKLDPAWPILAQASNTVHVNPKFLPAVQLPKETEPAPILNTPLLQEVDTRKQQLALFQALQPKETEPAPTAKTVLLQEVKMKKEQLRLMQALHQKKQELIKLKLQAALTVPSAIESLKVDSKKNINIRDPRLSKKMSAGSDSTVLQSVVVIPKGNVSRKNDKNSMPESKKIKLEDTVTDCRKDIKNKLNSNNAGGTAKLNVDLNASKPLQTANVQRNGRGKKRSFSPQNSLEFHAELNKGKKVPLTASEVKSNSGNNVQKKVNCLSEEPNDLVQEFESHDKYAHKLTVSEENKYHYKLQSATMANKELYNKSIQKLEPPPPPPLFLGNEDKDYRILPKTIDDRKMTESTYPKSESVPVVKSFILDKKERKVYFVNDKSFAFLDDNIPRELSFEGPPKLVLIEGLPQPIELGFGEEVKFDVDGKYNFIKFGTPSREVYINDYPYEAQFGGSPFTAVLSNGKIHRIQISGPLPQVILSELPAHELYERFCQNNQEFLRKFDSEPNINNKISSNMLVGTQDIDMRVKNPKLSSAFFNFPLERMHDIDWQRIHVGNSQQTEWNVPKNSFETFKDVDPNFVAHPNHPENPEWNSSLPISEVQNAPMKPPPLPPKHIINSFPSIPAPSSSTTFGPAYGNSPLMQLTSNEHSRPISVNNVSFSHPIPNTNEFAVIRPELNMVNKSAIPRLSPPPLPPFLGPVPNTSCITSSVPLPVSVPYSNTPVSAPLLPLPCTSAPVLNLPPLQSVTRLAAPLPVTNFTAATQMSSFTGPVNMPNFPSTSSVATNDMQLFMEKLKAAGLIGNAAAASASTVSSESEKKEDKIEELPKAEAIPEITFDSKCLKKFHSGVIAAIYSGLQCATCGMRFKEIQSEQYSRHLDWHFRRNRREKDGAKKPFSRRWFYEIKDWIEFKEFEDVDERTPSYFELQANVEHTEEVPETIRSVACSECDSEKCAVCGEQFQLFWIEEEEEWHLRNAVKHEDEAYHPACFEDFKKANDPTTADPDTSFDESATDIKTDANEVDADMKIKTEEMDVCIKLEKEEEMDVDIKLEKDQEDVDMKLEKEMDVDMKLVKEKMDVCIKVEEEEMDVDIKIKEVDVAAEENVAKIVEAKGLEKMDVEVKDVETVDPVVNKVVIKLEHDRKTDFKELEQDEKAKSKELEQDEKAKSKELKKDEKAEFKQLEKDEKTDSKELEQDEKADFNELEQDEKTDFKELKQGEKTDSKELEHDDKRDSDKLVHVEIADSKELENSKKEDSKELEQDKKTDSKELENDEKADSEELKHDEKVDSVEECKEEKTEVKVDSLVNECIIKEEMIETTEKVHNDENNKHSGTDNVNLKRNADVPPVDSDKTKEQSQLSSHTENVPIKFEDELEDIEFRPPTPDPKFQVLDPVFKGTEISNLCTIM